MPSSTFQKFAFTIYGEPPIYQPEYMGFLCYQKEVCPDTKKEHYQGYCELKTRRAMKKLKEIFAGDPHVEAAKGTAEENIAYCSKLESAFPDTFVSFGAAIKSIQGERNDIKYFHTMVLQGIPIDDIVLQYPAAVRLYKSLVVIQHAQFRTLSRALRDVKVSYYWGLPGTGKSRSVYEQCKDTCFRPTISSAKHFWFDSYAGEVVLWLDDFDRGDVITSELLHVLDRYPLPIQTKGGTSFALWTRVYITANIPPPMSPADPLTRRIHEVKHFREDGEVFFVDHVSDTFAEFYRSDLPEGGSP